ncbi:hypothetical protein CY34DRAFT_17227 [Suillus luteus UH-Slu-Lm8-n1]|uniref:Uncharacterized protein n=1 Tax=Suillus luteus UH-Slu-Lm8-n1 TaxID=930992 RepID=A0A0D0AT53_9AGAM|nr:hypothetical protein CY34DRAFT_17227 [Suillus luteus UH-Slu-Lm8-n1]
MHGMSQGDGTGSVLPPQPSKSTRKAPILAVEAVWRYNMAAHILDHHNEYAVPGQREAGVPLPMSVWKVMKLTDLEQSASHIPKERWQPLYSHSTEQDKENVPAASGSHTKCSAMESAGSLPFKRARTSLQPITITHSYFTCFERSLTAHLVLIN